MANLRERRRQLLNLTITEIILILLFLILLITASYIKKNRDLIEENKKLTDQNNEYKALNVDAARLIEFRKFEKAINDLKESNGEFADMEIEEIIGELILARENYKKIKEKDSEIAKLMNKLKDFEKAKEQLAYYKERYGNDKPPCWKKEGTIAKPEYLYDAIINDLGIVLINTDQRYPHRVNDRKNLPLINVVENTTLNSEDFLNQTREVFELNKETCRHYLLVKDQSGNNKNHFKKYLRAIEDRFYKYEDK